MKKRTALLVPLVFLALAGFFYFGTSKPVDDAYFGNLFEVAEVSGKQWDYPTLAKYFKELAQAKGAKYAYVVLREAVLPPNTDLHLLGHVIGDELYIKKGLSGIYVCTPEFRNSCSHSIVVGLFSDKGDGALQEIADACRKAPGGSGAYTMCFHGLGHGILSAYGYDIEKTNESCKKTGTAVYNDREYVECVGGAVMEIISGGGHDHEIWERQRPKYLKKDDPLSLCRSPYMTDSVQSWCFNYLTPYLFEAVGGDIGHPAPEDFEKAFKLCDTLPVGENRAACFGGFGKEFVVLAQDRDIRRIDQMNEQQLGTVYDWCLLADDPDGIQACLVNALASLYWGGENNRSASISFCSIMSDLEHQRGCFSTLIGFVGSYINDRAYRSSFCGELPQMYQAQCNAQLLE